MTIIKNQYDLIIIGAGPAGTPISIESAKLDSTKSIALIDNLGELGGECLFHGCIPSKILEASAKHIKDLENLKEFGIELNSDSYKLIWKKIKKRKNEILSKRTKIAKDLANSVGNIDIIKGFATFNSNNSIEVILKDKTTKILEFRKVVIATGSKPIISHYKGDAIDEIMTNDEFFHNMELPETLSIIGSGAIAIEFTQILSALGVKINLFVRGDKILKNIDNEAADMILDKLLNSNNINLLLNSTIQEINHKENQLEILYTQNSKSKTLISNKVLSAIGRIANISKLNLEKADVEYNKKGITTTPQLQTSNKNIFANGDVVANFPKFAHTAQYTSHIVAQNLFLEHNFFKPNFSKNSWVLFSMPNIVSAGIGENEAKKNKIDIIVDKFDFSTEAKSQIENEDYGYMKFIVEKSSKKIIGIVIVHEDANVMGGEASLIISQKLTLKELIDSIHPHPTMSEAFVMLAKKMMGDIMHEKLTNPIIQSLLKIERLM